MPVLFPCQIRRSKRQLSTRPKPLPARSSDRLFLIPFHVFSDTATGAQAFVSSPLKPPLPLFPHAPDLASMSVASAEPRLPHCCPSTPVPNYAINTRLRQMSNIAGALIRMRGRRLAKRPTEASTCATDRGGPGRTVDYLVPSRHP